MRSLSGMLQRLLRRPFLSNESDPDDGDLEAGFASQKRQRRGRHPLARMIQFLRVRLKHHYRLHTGFVICLALLLGVCFFSLVVGLWRHMGVRVRGPGALYARQSYPYERLQNLVMVAGHAIYTGSHCEEADGENSWFLEPYQKHPGQASTFVAHIRAGVETASGDTSALLLFSGGETRKPAGPRSEAQSYWNVAESKEWFGTEEAVRDRALTEEHARDSYENLLFSICRFRELSGKYPKNVTVVSYDFKQERFVNLHRKAIRFPPSDFFYVGTPAAPSAATAAILGEENVQSLFRNDPYGCASPLSTKRSARDPFARQIPYPTGCPELGDLFAYCGDSFEGWLPWDPNFLLFDLLPLPTAIMAKALYAHPSSWDGGDIAKKRPQKRAWTIWPFSVPIVQGSTFMQRTQGCALRIIISLVLIFPCIQSLPTQFSFSEFSEDSTDILFLGDAAIVDGVIELTENRTSSDSSSTGRALYSEALQVLDPVSNQTSSFSTMFSFAMLFPPNVTIIREGLSFIFVPDKFDMGESGSQLGIYNTTNTVTSRHTVALIFDTYTTEGGNDNHVGVSLTNNTSIFSTNLGDMAINFRNGSVIVTWIEYDSRTNSLDVTLGYDAARRPRETTLTCTLDLSSVFKPFMYVGFSASDIDSGSGPRHTVHSWEFTSSGIEARSSSAPAVLRKSFIAGFTILIFVTLLACSSVLWLRQKQKAIAQFRRAELYEREVMNGPRKFSYKRLSLATRSFDDKEQLGLGGEGTVFRGVLPDSGYLVAVKRVSDNFQLGGGEVLSHLDVLGQLRHRHLVQLHGWCYDKGEVLLVYEFMPNGSLDKVLFDRKGDVLSWSHRFSIITGVAGALEYLHQGWEEVVVHRNIKPSNVMLDNNFSPKLGDYGIAQLIRYYNRRETTVVAGTFGYLASEVVQTGKATEMSDVFSFGALTMEVACGRRALDTSLPADKTVLIDWVWRLHLKGRLLEAADPRLNGGYDVEEMTMLLHLGLLCTQPSPSSRPSMAQVADILARKAPLPAVPHARADTGSVAGHSGSFISGLTIEELISDDVARLSPDVVMNISPTTSSSYGHKSVEIFENVGL